MSGRSEAFSGDEYVGHTEKRRKKRHEFQGGLDVVDPATGRFIGQLTNLTSSGMRLVADYPVQIGNIMTVDIELPEPEEGRTRIDIRMQCRWCHRSVDKSCFEAGFRFVNTTFRQKLLLETFLDRHAHNVEAPAVD
ncbi:MAG: PilZ domain-containing protein [Pseudomonadota bacterium]